jgi:limonene-1,2-epoxide hydrolase
MSSAVSAVENFFTALETKSIEDCAARFGEAVTDDFVWVNSGFPTCNGREAAQQFLLGFAQAIPLTGLKIETLAIAAAGNKVITERIDHFIDASGTILASLPLAGILEVAEDGRISGWRDYFDPRPLLGG